VLMLSEDVHWPPSYFAQTHALMHSGTSPLCLYIYLRLTFDFSIRVRTGAAMWASWLVTVPLLGFTCLTFRWGSVRVELGSSDKEIVLDFFFMVLLGCFSVMPPFSQFTGFVFFVLSSGFMLRAIYLLYNDYVRLRQLHRDDDMLDAVFSVKKELSSYLCIIFPFFPVVYVLGVTKILDADQIFVCFAFLDVFSKGIFTFLVMDSHLVLLFQVENKLTAERKNLGRLRKFMRYMFHEMRIPLNTIALAVECGFRDRLRAPPAVKDLFQEMSGALSFMDMALNSYQTMLFIEEKSLTLTSQELIFSVMLIDAVDWANTVLKNRNNIYMVKFDSPDTCKVLADTKLLFHAFKCFLALVESRKSPGMVHVLCKRSTVTDNECGPATVFELSMEDAGVAYNAEMPLFLEEPYNELFEGNLLVDGVVRTTVNREIFRAVIQMHSGSIRKERGNGGCTRFVLTVKVQNGAPMTISAKTSARVNGMQNNNLTRSIDSRERLNDVIQDDSRAYEKRRDEKLNILVVDGA
jgi:hypothetical protein